MDWYDIGLQLEIEKHVLDIIKSDCQNKIGDCFREMLAHWLENDQLATEFHLQKAIKGAECSTNSLPPSLNKWYKDLSRYWAAIILPSILGMTLFMYYQHSNSPIKSAAETLKNEYRAHKVMRFNLPISGNSDLEYLGVVMKDTDRREFGHNELVQHYSGKAGRLIITGLPGSGKTTLLRHLAKEWANGRALKSCQILFLISLGSLEGEVNTIGDLLSKSGFGDITNLKQVSEKIYATNGVGACFLFDAYDELKLNRQFIDMIMEGSKINSSFCLLTSRPFFREIFKKQTRFEIIGYDIDNLSQYLHKLSDNATLISVIQQSWGNSTNVKEMCTLPLHMVMMLYIYSYESNVSIRTTTQLYIAFMNVTTKHYEGQRHDWNTESLWQCIRAEGPRGDDLCSAFNILHHVAYDIVFKGQDSFQDIFIAKDYINQLGFVGVTSVPGSKSQVKFAFSHPTFLEFFAALHITTLPLNEQLAFITVYQDKGKESYMRPYLIAHQEYSLSRVMYVEFYLGLVGNKFHYNISGATPFLKQLFLETSVENGVCFVYKWVEKNIGWITDQYRNTIDSVFKANYSMCAYHSFLSPLGKQAPDFRSELFLLPWDTHKLALVITRIKPLNNIDVSSIMVTSVDNTYMTKQDQLNLLFCIQGLRENSNCHGLRLRSVTSLTVTYYPYLHADTLYKMKRALPNLEYIKIRLLSNDWNQFNDVIESKALNFKQLEIVSALLNLRINIHLNIDIDRCSVDSTRMLLDFDQISHISLQHIIVTGVCQDNNVAKHLCKNVLKYSIFVENDAHAKSLITCIQQAQNLKTFSLAYYEGVIDTIKQKEIFRNLPHTLQTLNVCGFERSDLIFCDDYCEVSSTLDVKLIVDSLIERKNLRSLTLSISSVEDMKTLTQLSFLIHLHIIWNDPLGSMDKSTIAHTLQNFPHLESFTLISNCYPWSDYDKQEILSIIFTITPARDIRICLSQFNPPPQFDEIIERQRDVIELQILKNLMDDLHYYDEYLWHL